LLGKQQRQQQQQWWWKQQLPLAVVQEQQASVKPAAGNAVAVHESSDAVQTSQLSNLAQIK
jgi:hypothetical protein